MRLLFVKLKHIGDSLLLTPTLTAARAAYPTAMLWVVVRRGCEGVLAGCPAIDRVLTAAAPESQRRSWLNWWQDGRLISEIRRQRFDHAFELSDGDRGRWICTLSRARNRCTNAAGRPLNWWWRRRFNRLTSVPWLERHRVEKDFLTVNEVLPLGETIPPLAFVRRLSRTPVLGQKTGAYAILHPGTRWKRKRWPVEKWVEVGRFLVGQGLQIVLSTGPDQEEVQLSRAIVAALGPGSISTEGGLTWAELAGLLYEARLFVGVDTAAMHLAAACQCPTVAILGPSSETEWRPWQVPCRVITPSAAARQTVPAERLIETTEVSAVVQACQEMLRGQPAGGETPAK